ncbi:26864_t:CDS:1, partial [Racocetra persica]
PSKEKSTSSANQPKENNPTPTPLSQLSDPELTKCLLEDFSRRLELEKYFVFGLGELKTMKEEPAKKGKTIISNWRVVSQILGDSLTKLTISYGK